MPAVLLLSLLLVSCGPKQPSPEAAGAAACAAVDTDASLEDTARCHHLGRTRAEQWGLVSQATRANTTEAAWSEAAVAHQTVDAMFSATDCTSLGVSPGTTLELEGKMFGQVYHTQRCTRRGEVCEYTSAETWVQEEDGWRHLALPATASASLELQESAEFQALLDGAKVWHQQEPLSSSPLVHQAVGYMNGANSPDPESASEEDWENWQAEREALVARMAEQAPEATASRLVAVTLAANLPAAERALAQLSANNCGRWMAVTQAILKGEKEQEILAALSKADPEGHQTFLIKLMILSQSMFVAKKEQARELLSSEVAAQALALTREAEEEYLLFVSFTVTGAAVELGLLEPARAWLALGLEASPENPALLEQQEAVAWLAHMQEPIGPDGISCQQCKDDEWSDFTSSFKTGGSIFDKPAPTCDDFSTLMGDLDFDGAIARSREMDCECGAQYLEMVRTVTSGTFAPETTPQFVSCETDADCVAYTYPWGGEGPNLPQGYLDAIDVTAAGARWSGTSCQVPMATLREDFCDDCDHAPETRGLICEPSNWARDARVCVRGERTE